LGIIWKRVNAQGAIATLFFGLLIGTLRIIAELTVGEAESGMWATFANINFANMAIFMFIACVIVCTVVSLMTPPPDMKQIEGLTFGTLSNEQKASNKNSYTMLDIAASVLLIVIVIGILSYFTG
jgi:SSS family solute:Na+ symporter